MKKFSGPIFSAALLALLLWAYARHNNFPFYYHTDEPGKVEQVVSGEHNYRHPLLMINATDLVVRALKIDKAPQKVVLVGRWTSALAAVLAIAAVILIVRRHSDWRFGLLAGAMAGLHPFLFEATHYMKEDCFLLAGLAWTWYALDRFCDSESNTSLVLAGIATGVAASAKYLGILALVFSIALLIFKVRRATWWSVISKLFLLCSVCLLTFALFNFQSVIHPVEALNGIGREFGRINRDQTSAFFETNYFLLLISHAGPLLLIGGLIYLATFFRRREKKELIERALLIFALAYLVALCFTPLKKDRYLIPLATLLSIFTVWGIRSAASWIAERYPRFPQSISAALTCVAVVFSELPFVVLDEKEFAHDQRTEMVEWIRDHLPANAVIAHETRIWPSRDAHDWRTQLPQRRVSPPFFSITLKNIDNMKQLGVTHVVAAGSNYRRTVGEDHVSISGNSEFYNDLEKNGTVLWQTPPGRILYLSPGLTIYALPQTR